MSNWDGRARGTSRRSAPMPPGWAKTRLRILRRDRYRCVKCGAPATSVDHVVPAVEGGGEDDANLQSLCARCHGVKTGHEAGVRSPTKGNPNLRKSEPHPGLLPPDERT